ncbi:hypothetical protein J4N45_14505 [Vibrio sp. SCSIO 43140]|uniref:hypothetical protein n=1 Tax=Vibrio sp. SCSIO 43140 TaxID=2819100 RepID=UPI002074DCCE|nr:hypothetical protein [Vibrio sp. SCSIO 43140]USD58800.1 hypothetical protein J4N45_09680 [Vibrio sp. SCSIO 43140]USD59134.1 hypothetical protein J4N45_11385 [Vibrio sp. SCSIO 43140]USD59713.1 hypothetical protein J4N45_14505 [Vibrio sp. SCSIO 43140]
MRKTKGDLAPTQEQIDKNIERFSNHKVNKATLYKFLKLQKVLEKAENHNPVIIMKKIYGSVANSDKDVAEPLSRRNHPASA